MTPFIYLRLECGRPLARTLAAAALATLLAAAQARAGSAVLPPAADPAQVVPNIPYDSPLATYRPFRDGPRAPWRAVNDVVRKTGGHVGALRDEAGANPVDAPNALGPQPPIPGQSAPPSHP
jgi:hypothetical protein